MTSALLSELCIPHKLERFDSAPDAIYAAFFPGKDSRNLESLRRTCDRECNDWRTDLGTCLTQVEDCRIVLVDEDAGTIRGLGVALRKCRRAGVFCFIDDAICLVRTNAASFRLLMLLCCGDAPLSTRAVRRRSLVATFVISFVAGALYLRA